MKIFCYDLIKWHDKHIFIYIYIYIERERERERERRERERVIIDVHGMESHKIT